MRAVIQRVSSASVTVDDGKGESGSPRLIAANTGKGFLVLVGFTHSDDEAALAWVARKIVGLRIFEENGRGESCIRPDNDSTNKGDLSRPYGSSKMNLSLADVGGELLVVSQFTLYADIAKGRRPSFTDAAAPDKALQLYERFVALLRQEGVTVKTGIFGAKMQVSLVNDGPVTIIVESPGERLQALGFRL